MAKDFTDWTPRQPPVREKREGRMCWLEPLSLKHMPQLHAAYTGPGGIRGWDYMNYGPFESDADFQAYVEAHFMGEDPCFFTVFEKSSGRAVGMISYLRLRPAHGSIEIGHVHFSPLMAGTVMSTEAQYLMMSHVMDDLQYRRLEWRCNAANAASRRAADRLGYTFEGIFRQDMVTKGKSRDTAWHSVLDHEWPRVKAGLETWLDPSNFDANGLQIRSLKNCYA